MNNSMVAHLWANEKKESARGSNLFFEGRSIYSYGYHFEVGRIVRNKCGEKAYLLNDKYYSSSTCKHQRCVRSAIPTGSKVFSVGYNMSDDATWLHQSCCCDHCVNHWGIDLCECGSGARVGECECGSQKAHDTLGVKYDSFGAILKNFG